MPELTATRPRRPSPTPRRGSPRPSRPPATRSSTCRTGSTPTRSRRSRSTRPPPGSPRSCARHGYAVEHPAGRLATAIRATPPRRPRRRRPADRDPRRVRRAARSRPRLRPQHDGRLRGRCGDRAGGDRRRAARRDRVPRHAGRGAGQRQADHDRRRPVRRASTPRCSTTRATGQPRREPPARVRGRRRRLHTACRRTPRPIRGGARTRSTR